MSDEQDNGLKNQEQQLLLELGNVEQNYKQLVGSIPEESLKLVDKLENDGDVTPEEEMELKKLRFKLADVVNKLELLVDEIIAFYEENDTNSMPELKKRLNSLAHIVDDKIKLLEAKQEHLLKLSLNDNVVELKLLLELEGVGLVEGATVDREMIQRINGLILGMYNSFQKYVLELTEESESEKRAANAVVMATAATEPPAATPTIPNAHEPSTTSVPPDALAPIDRGEIAQPESVQRLTVEQVLADLRAQYVQTGGLSIVDDVYMMLGKQGRKVLQNRLGEVFQNVPGREMRPQQMREKVGRNQEILNRLEQKKLVGIDEALMALTRNTSVALDGKMAREMIQNRQPEGFNSMVVADLAALAQFGIAHGWLAPFSFPANEGSKAQIGQKVAQLEQRFTGSIQNDNQGVVNLISYFRIFGENLEYFLRQRWEKLKIPVTDESSTARRVESGARLGTTVQAGAVEIPVVAVRAPEVVRLPERPLTREEILTAFGISEADIKGANINFVRMGSNILNSALKVPRLIIDDNFRKVVPSALKDENKDKDEVWVVAEKVARRVLSGT